MSKNNRLIAVYGTLRYGGSANGLLEGATYLGKDSIAARLYNLGWYPGIKLIKDREEDNHNTVVDVYELPEENYKDVLSRMDAYEGYQEEHPKDSLFVRTETHLLETGEKTMVYEYCFDVNDNDLIADGDWLKNASS